MIGRALVLSGLAACLIGCGARERALIVWPTLPALSAEQEAECPPAEQLTGELGDLAAKDADLAIEYARCRLGKGAVVDAYNLARTALEAAASMAERPR